MQTRYVRRTGWDLAAHVALALGFYALAAYMFSVGGFLGIIGGTINAVAITGAVCSKGYWRRAVYSE